MQVVGRLAVRSCSARGSISRRATGPDPRKRLTVQNSIRIPPAIWQVDTQRLRGVE